MNLRLAAVSVTGLCRWRVRLCSLSVNNVKYVEVMYVGVIE